jgi:hypothetical protein
MALARVCSQGLRRPFAGLRLELIVRFYWGCLFLCRNAEAMRIAVVVGKDKLGLPIVSMFEF